MKAIFLILPLSICSNLSLSQTNSSLNDLQRKRNQLIEQKATIEDSIAIIDIKINALLRKSSSVKSGDFISIQLEQVGKLRDKPDPIKGDIITVIPIHARIKLISYSKDYFLVEYKNVTGYLNELYIPNDLPEVIEFKKRFAKTSTIYSSPSYNTSPTYQLPSKANSSGSGCASTQCWGTTKKGGRCRNRTTNCSGYCYLHGG